MASFLVFSQIKIFGCVWFHISHVLGAQSHLSCFIAYCLGNLIRNIIAKDENFLFKNISDIKMEYGLRCKEKFQ